MNKKNSNSRHYLTLLRTCALVLLCSCALLLTGCGQFPGNEDFYEIKIPPEKLRQIETLELQEAKVEENNRADANEVPPRELGLTLEQCRALTLENNLDLKVRLISPAIAAERVDEEQAAFEAIFSTNLIYSKTDTPTASELDVISGSQVSALYTGLGV